MTSPPADPLIWLRRSLRHTWAVTAAVVLVCGAWVLAPIGSTPPYDIGRLIDESGASSTTTDEVITPINQEVFAAAQLWNPQPLPEEKHREQETRPIARPKLHLIGIIEENGERFAALQDLGTGKLLIVSSGDSIPPYTVTSITPQAVVLEHQRTVAHLTIARDHGERTR